MAESNCYQRLTMAKSYKKALIALSIFEIFLALASIGLTIPAIILARQNYLDCYTSLQSTTVTECQIYSRMNTYTLTSQGIWEGVLVIIAAAITIDFTRVSSWKTYSYMNGFSSLSNALSGTMILFEALAISEYIGSGYTNRSTNDYPLWCLHVTLISVACVLWLVTTAKKVAIMKTRSWGKIAVSDSNASL